MFPRIDRPLSAIMCAALLGVGVATSHADDIVKINFGRGALNVFVPEDYEEAVPAPLIILLHGYSSNGATQESYMRFRRLVDEFGFLYVHPDGTFDRVGNRFWNATDACCNFFNSGIDDSGYVRKIIDTLRDSYAIDGRRIYVVGHSNGGFMSYRLACDHAETIAAIASLAGATFLEEDDCTPAVPVHVLQIHGDQDNTVLYDGGCFTKCYPGAIDSVETWVAYDGCETTTEEGDPLDLDRDLPGDETTVLRYRSGCQPGGSGELWTIVDGSHVPDLSDGFSRRVVEWFLAHPKPPTGRRGDLNCDGALNFADIDGFVLALTDRREFYRQNPGCDPDLADLNGDQAVDFDDVDPFVACLVGQDCE